MKKGLVPLLLVGLLSSCSILSTPSKPERKILMGFYEKGAVFVIDADSDGRFDKKLYYELTGAKDIEDESLNFSKYFIFEYRKSEAYLPARDIPDFPCPDLDLEKNVAFSEKK